MHDGERREALAAAARSRERGDALSRGVMTGRTAAYSGKFANWYQKASVRSRPRRMLGEPGPDQPFFPPELVPAASHPLVVKRGPEAIHQLLVHHLYQYLSFTVELEAVAVMPVVTRMARGRSGLPLPPEMCEDSFKIATDEAWHAQFSFDLIRQVQAATGAAFAAGTSPAFVARLAAVREGLGSDLAPASELLFAVVSETLISRILSGVPRDGRLPSAVRAAVADHAQDEGRHHSFFRDVLDIFWASLTRGQRQHLGPWIPELIYAFLEPDYAGAGTGLARIGLLPQEIEEVLRASYGPAAVRSEVAAAASATVRYFREAGALGDARTRHSFAAAGLVPGDALVAASRGAAE